MKCNSFFLELELKLQQYLPKLVTEKNCEEAIYLVAELRQFVVFLTLGHIESAIYN